MSHIHTVWLSLAVLKDYFSDDLPCGCLAMKIQYITGTYILHKGDIYSKETKY